MLAKIRQRQSAWTSRVLGMFAVAWVSMAIQPCAMATGEAGDCPHCPPAMSAEHHGGQMASGPMPCVDSGDCDNFDHFNYDGRSAKVKFENAHGDLHAGVVSKLALIPRDDRQAARPAYYADPGGPGVPPPLNVLYCVYLD